METDEGVMTVSEEAAVNTVAPQGAHAEPGPEPAADDRRRSKPRKPLARLKSVPSREWLALGGAVAFLLLGFAGIYIVVKVAGEKDGTVLIALVIIPPLLYLLLSGRVQDLKGPAGLELTLAEVANRSVPLADHANGTQELSFEKIESIAKGRTATLDERIRKIPADAPVVLTFTLGSAIDGHAAANYAKHLTQLRRFRYVAIVDSHRKLVSYMEERAFRHTMDADDPVGVTSAMTLINNIREQQLGEVKGFPGMIHHTLSPRTSIAEALRKMERTHLNALLVVDQGVIRGIVERDRLANTLLLSLIDEVSGRAGR
jgi:CBS domain-containing protein